ncbi:hypothetical protein [Phytoactinopolyspora halotolerans]|uniref:DUF2771 family protein n=1 Tax=Phytoactinopolyspora halotolerans TaxID=1981512 RepID=A0A6L9SJL3_9ACTN|nr:hypothetical protein [Phytoactinopolyspora halotolerans]NEE04270.1 hypothetical protein [Phytoactinopolyspora halotolerans]
MRRTVLPACAAFLALMFAACSDDDGGGGGDGGRDAGDGGDAGDGSAAADGECPDVPQITLQDAGDEPREAVQLSPTPGDSMVLQTSISADSTHLIDGEEQSVVDPPDMSFALELTVEDVDDEHIATSFVFTDATPTAGSHVAMEDAIRGMAGLEGTLTTTRAGALLDVEIADRSTLESGDGHEVPTVLSQIDWQLTEMPIPFPEGEVGVGAEWSTFGPLDPSDTERCVEVGYTLTSRDGDTYAVEADWHRDDTTDGYSTEATEDGADADAFEVLSETMSTSTVSTGRLDFPVPVSSSTEAVYASVLEVEQDDGTRAAEEWTSRYTMGFEPPE